MTFSPATACYPGSFNPCTVAHLAIADTAHEQLGVSSIELVLSEIALGKEHSDVPDAPDRADAIRRVRGDRPWLSVRVTHQRLLADIAEGYDWLIVGADKWTQLIDPSWYGGLDGRSDALVRLPRIAVAPRPPHALPTVDDLAALDATLPHLLHVVVLDVAPHLAEVSSTAVREGRSDWHAGHHRT
jgi:nicotinic acid mononucleotide adenylyltransferase